MRRTKADKDRWIKDTQLFQHIAGQTESSYEELEKDWDSFTSKRKKFESENAETTRIISEVAKEAGENRKS